MTLSETPTGRVHTCSACGKQEVWGPTWAWYGSYKQMDNDEPLFKACSDACMARREEVEEKNRADKNIAQARKSLAEAERNYVLAKNRLERLTAKNGTT